MVPLAPPAGSKPPSAGGSRDSRRLASGQSPADVPVPDWSFIRLLLDLLLPLIFTSGGQRCRCRFPKHGSTFSVHVSGAWGSRALGPSSSAAVAASRRRPARPYVTESADSRPDLGESAGGPSSEAEGERPKAAAPPRRGPGPGRAGRNQVRGPGSRTPQRAV